MEKRTVRTGNKRYLMHCVRICVPLCRLRRMSGSPWWRATACNDYISIVFCGFFRNGFKLVTRLLTSIDEKSPTFHSYAGAKHFEMFAFYWFVTMPYSSSSVDALVRGMQGEKKMGDAVTLFRWFIYRPDRFSDAAFVLPITNLTYFQ